MGAKKIPSAQEISKKLKLSIDLFVAAYEIKKHQLRKKYPEKTERELSYMTMELFEKADR